MSVVHNFAQSRPISRPSPEGFAGGSWREANRGNALGTHAKGIGDEEMGQQNRFPMIEPRQCGFRREKRDTNERNREQIRSPIASVRDVDRIEPPEQRCRANKRIENRSVPFKFFKKVNCYWFCDFITLSRIANAHEHFGLMTRGVIHPRSYLDRAESALHGL
jgi:hypothetical protein